MHCWTSSRCSAAQACSPRERVDVGVPVRRVGPVTAPDRARAAIDDDRRFTGDELADLAAARLLAADAMPYLASTLFEVVLVRAPGLDTFAVDARWRLYVDPARIRSWGVLGTAGVLLHEVGHLLRDHHARAAEQGDVDALRWNIAADAEINDDLIAAGVHLPGSPVTPAALDQPDGLLAEQYLSGLMALLGDPGCGSGSGGLPQPVELDDDDAAAPGRSDLEQELARRAAAGAIDAASRGELDGVEPGTVPGGWQRWARHELEPPRIDWRQQLRIGVRRGLATRAGTLEATYRRPGRRRIPHVITPGMHQPRPSIGVVIDTSSSMAAKQLHAALAELDGICRRTGIDRDHRVVVTADVAVHEVPALRSARTLELRGGGGTDLRPAIVHLAAHRRRPGTLVVLTDGFTPWPDRPLPGRRVITVLLGRDDGQRPPSPPDWIHTIRLPPT
jgi:predicted metal-dependent peptidase